LEGKNAQAQNYYIGDAPEKVEQAQNEVDQTQN
jgi:hypothetical protein